MGLFHPNQASHTEVLKSISNSKGAQRLALPHGRAGLMSFCSQTPAHLSLVLRIGMEPAPGADGHLIKREPEGLAIAVVDGQVLHVEWNVRGDRLRGGQGAGVRTRPFSLRPWASLAMPLNGPREPFDAMPCDDVCALVSTDQEPGGGQRGPLSNPENQQRRRLCPSSVETLPESKATHRASVRLHLQRARHGSLVEGGSAQAKPCELKRERLPGTSLGSGG